MNKAYSLSTKKLSRILSPPKGHLGKSLSSPMNTEKSSALTSSPAGQVNFHANLILPNLILSLLFKNKD